MKGNRKGNEKIFKKNDTQFFFTIPTTEILILITLIPSFIIPHFTMKSRSFIFLAAFMLIFSACHTTSNEKEKTPDHQKDTSITKINNPYHIELNDGKKWKVVPEMMAIIRSMETQVNEFQGKEIDQHINNALKLQHKVDSLTSNCTMTGKAHDELHKWLLPYLDMVDAYNHANNQEDADSIFLEIKNSFVNMNQFFE